MGCKEEFESEYAGIRRALAQPIRDFSQRNHSQAKRLIIDGTGPCVTMHMPFLRGAGLETIRRFDDIHAFSGGVFSFLFFLAYEAGEYLHPMETYYRDLDASVRKAHNQKPLQALHLAKNLLLKKPLYEEQHYKDIFDYAFTQNFLRASLDDVAPNFFPYVAIKGQDEPVPICEHYGFDRKKICVYDVLLYAMRIPMLYGAGTDQAPYYDANFSRAFKKTRKQLLHNSEGRSLTMTMWNKTGTQDSASFINVLGNKSANLRFRTDILSIALNIPNPRYASELYLAFA